MIRVCSTAIWALVAGALVPAGLAAGVNVLPMIKPGVTTSADLVRFLGRPVSESVAPALFTSVGSGIREFAAWCEPDGVLTFARVTLTNDLTPDSAAIVLEVPGDDPARVSGNSFATEPSPALTTLSWTSVGVHLIAAGQSVREIWLLRPGDKPTDVAARLTRVAAQAGPVPVGGSPASAVTPAPTAPVTTIESTASGIGLDDFAQSVKIEARVGDGRAARMLGVSKLSYLFAVGTDGFAGLVVSASVSTRALTNENVSIFIGLRAPGEAPPGVTADNLRLSAVVSGEQQVLEQLPVFVPVANLPRVPSGVAVLHYEAGCAGLVSFVNCECLLNPGTQVAAPLKYLVVSDLRFEPGARLNDTPGAWFLGEVVAVGLKGRSLAGWVRFQLPDGTLVRPTAKAAQLVDSAGALALVAQDTPQHDSTSWSPFRVFVPYDAVSLPRGRHRIVARFSVSSENLMSCVEQEVDLNLP